MREKVNFTYGHIKPLKRVLLFLVDICIFFILGSMVYTFISFSIVSSTAKFKEQVSIQETTLEKCREMYFDGHLLVKNSKGEALTGDEMLVYYIESKLNETSAVDANGKYNDIIAYFYLNYANESLTHDKVQDNYDLDFVNGLFKESNEGNVVLWDLSNKTLPAVLKEDRKAEIKAYIEGNKTVDNEKTYLYARDFIMNNLLEMEMVLSTSDTYNAHYSIVMSSNENIYYYISISSSITYTVMFALYFVVFPIISKHGQTWGMKLLNLQPYNYKQQVISKKSVVLKGILDYVTYYFLANFLPILAAGVGVFMMPIIRFGGTTIRFFIFSLLTLLLTLISFIVSLASKDHQKPSEYVTGVYLLDHRVYIEPKDDVVFEGEK